MIIKDLLNVITELRNSGYNVSTEEISDFLQALKVLPLEEWNLKDLLYITLVKDEIKLQMMETFFQLKLFEHTILVDNGIGTSVELYSPLDLKVKLVQNIIVGDMQNFKKIVRHAIKQIHENINVQNFDEFFIKVKVFLEWKVEENTIIKSGDPILISNLRHADYILEQEVKTFWYRKLTKEMKQDFLKKNLLLNKDLASLNSNEQIIIEHYIRKLSRLLAVRKGRRWKKSKNGILDLKKNFSNILKNNFMSTKIYYKKLKKTKTKLYVICDISGSVSNYALFLLQLVQSLYNVYHNVRAIVFVDRAVEITNMLQFNKLSKDDIIQIFNSQASLTGFSNYESAGLQCCEILSDQHYPHSVLIILGDCRTNYQPAGIKYWKHLCSKFSRTIFLNPEPAERWNKDDSQVKDFYSLFHYFFECRNIYQLECIVKFLL